MSIFKITTVETIPAIRKYEYTIEAIDEAEAKKKLKSGLYNEVDFIREIDSLAVIETEILDIQQED
jgi:malonyl CoA-acyl carrier protein transacylase